MNDGDRVKATPPAAETGGQPDSTLDVAEVIARVAHQGSQKRFGWSVLDSLELGFNAGELAVVAGRTGHGKSTVLLNVLLNWMLEDEEQHFILFSHEIPAEAVVIKLLSILTRKRGELGWSYHDIRRWAQQGEVPAGLQRGDIQGAIDQFGHLQRRLSIIYEPDWGVLDIQRRAREIAEAHPRIGGVMIDYLQLVPPPPGRYESQEQEISATAKELKRLGVQLECPLVAAAQIGREAAGISDWIPEGDLEDERVLRAISKRRPQLHHLRQGGGEQEADLVVGLLNYRADFVSALEDSDADQRRIREMGTSGPFDVAVIKNRYGQLGVATLVLESRNGYIRDPGVFGR